MASCSVIRGASRGVEEVLVRFPKVASSGSFEPSTSNTAFSVHETDQVAGLPEKLVG
jgi:hypothetical protein